MSTEKQPVSPEKITKYGFAYAPPLIIATGIEYDVFSILEDGALDAQELATRTDTSPRGMRIVADALVGLELLSKDADGRYSNDAVASQFLLPSKPSFMGGLFKHIHQLLPAWVNLNETVKTGKPLLGVNQQDGGKEFFAAFVEDLFPGNYPAAMALAQHLNPPDDGVGYCILDLAAGSGVWSVALLQHSPKAQATAVDWAEVLEVTQRVTGRFGLADRYTYSPGDLLEADFGSCHQAAVMGHILHSEGEARSRDLLKKTYASLAPGGVLAIAEFLPNAERTGPLPALIFAINMLVNIEQGDTYSFEKISSWLTDVGFKDIRKLETPSPFPLILATK
ncbi:MAG: class I SAM-dependent methyltransferase [Abditibacteriaceae bacterium]